MKLSLFTSHKVVQYLTRLTRTGLYGFTVEQTAERLLCEALRNNWRIAGEDQDERELRRRARGKR